jgi:malate synthase
MTHPTGDRPPGVEFTDPGGEHAAAVLTGPALAFLADLHRRFDPRRRELLGRRAERDAELAAGGLYGFLPETKDVRESDWQVLPPAPGLADRRVEITGPTDAKMAINALNSGAKVWLADHEDATSPLWTNLVAGQANLRAAVDRTLAFAGPDGRGYALTDGPLATIVMRPRGWHLPEKHLLVDGERTSGGLVDFGLYAFHCAAAQLAAGSGPYFYLPKMESHLEARLWNDVFTHTEQTLGLPASSIRATVLIETFPAAFEMDEILYELRDHSAGLNAGRWDYMFSVIKKFRSRGADFLLPDRNSVSMTVPFMRAYTELLVQTCHKRGAHAIGGMAAFIPSRRDAEVNETALAKVRADKTREAGDGFDGSWVAHPDLVPICREVFDGVLGHRPNQLDRQRPEVAVTAEQLLDVKATPGEKTDTGLRNDISVGIQYLAAWLAGTGAVAVFNLMEDAATAEIARSQVWQWLHNDVRLDDTGEQVTADLVTRMAGEEVGKLAEPQRYREAEAMFVGLSTSDDFADFLTLPAYERML